MTSRILFLGLLLSLTACQGAESLDAMGVEQAIDEDSAEAHAVLALANDLSVTEALLDDDVGLDRRAAANIIEHRDGGSTPDLFDDIRELDSVAYVGASALNRMLEYALANGYGDTNPGGGGMSEADIELGMLALVNDAATNEPLLDDDVGLDRRAAANIIAKRNGTDGAAGTSDDDLFDSIAELDAVSYVGASALAAIRAYAIDNGYVNSVPPALSGLPTLGSPVQYANEWCTYGDTAPYVRSVEWQHPDIQAAMSALLPGYRSVFSYTEWRVAYALESESGASDQEKSFIRARNFMRVICGEHRDYPEMIGDKLRVIGQHTSTASASQLTNVNTNENLFDQLTYPGYVKLVAVMNRMHDARSQRGARDGYHYGFEAYGHGSRRVDHSVPPFTHCEMRFVFERYLTAGAPSVVPSVYEAQYANYRDTQCSEQDLGYMYNFRGHVNFQPLWLESNGFVHNSRRARGVELSRGTRESYMRPFATRHDAARRLLGTYLFHNDADHADMMEASESGGGPILYVTDQDADNDGVSDYRLMDQRGCGDQGVGLSVPSQNCNMVSWTTAWWTDTTTGHASSWNPAHWSNPDMGFLAAFPTFEERMDRFTAALDRHTNWGPTGYYMLDASAPDDSSPRFFGAYSPIVAASYDVSGSDFFIRRDYPSTDSFERGRAKWLFVMRFPVENYYDETSMAGGEAMDFERQYFNETSLSNDYYDERALDHWGYIPGSEMHAQVYLTYGDRGMATPAPVSVPAP